MGKKKEEVKRNIEVSKIFNFGNLKIVEYDFCPHRELGGYRGERKATKQYIDEFIKGMSKNTYLF